VFCPKFCSDCYIEFQQEILSGNVFRNFMHSKAFLLTYLCFSLVSVVLILAHIVLKSSEKIYTSTFICCLSPVKEALLKIKHQRRYKQKKPGRFVFEKTSFPVFLFSFWDLLRLIPWLFWSDIFTIHFLLCVLSCGWDLSLKFFPQDLQ